MLRLLVADVVTRKESGTQSPGRRGRHWQADHSASRALPLHQFEHKIFCNQRPRKSRAFWPCSYCLSFTMPDTFNNIFLTSENLAFSMPLILVCTTYVSVFSRNQRLSPSSVSFSFREVPHSIESRQSPTDFGGRPIVFA